MRERGATGGGGLAAMKYMTVSSSDSSWSKYVDREVNALRDLESNPHVIDLHGVYENVGSQCCILENRLKKIHCCCIHETIALYFYRNLE